MFALLKVKLKIKEVLEEKGLTQKDISEMTGIRPSTLSQIAGNRIDKVNLYHLATIMTALKIDSFDKILYIDEE